MSFLILHPKEVQILWSESEAEKDQTSLINVGNYIYSLLIAAPQGKHIHNILSAITSEEQGEERQEPLLSLAASRLQIKSKTLASFDTIFLHPLPPESVCRPSHRCNGTRFAGPLLYIRLSLAASARLPIKSKTLVSSDTIFLHPLPRERAFVDLAIDVTGHDSRDPYYTYGEHARTRSK